MLFRLEPDRFLSSDFVLATEFDRFREEAEETEDTEDTEPLLAFRPVVFDDDEPFFVCFFESCFLISFDFLVVTRLFVDVARGLGLVPLDISWLEEESSVYNSV